MQRFWIYKFLFLDLGFWVNCYTQQSIIFPIHPNLKSKIIRGESVLENIPTVDRLSIHRPTVPEKNELE